jgi:hypothetical protein
MVKRITVFTSALVAFVFFLFGQTGGDRAKQVKNEPPKPDLLAFREVWKAPTNEHVSVSQASLNNPNLTLHLYGSGKDMDTVAENGGPLHVWTGNCFSPCGLAFSDNNNYIDLTGLSRIKWTVKVSGFHKPQPVLKLADGSYLIGDQANGSVVDFQDVEFWIKDVRWMTLDAARLAPRGYFLPHPDLSKVDEIGFVDLMVGAGQGPGAYVDIGMFEVYGKPVPRAVVSATK